MPARRRQALIACAAFLAGACSKGLSITGEAADEAHAIDIRIDL